MAFEPRLDHILLISRRKLLSDACMAVYLLCVRVFLPDANVKPRTDSLSRLEGTKTVALNFDLGLV